MRKLIIIVASMLISTTAMASQSEPTLQKNWHYVTTSSVDNTFYVTGLFKLRDNVYSVRIGKQTKDSSLIRHTLYIEIDIKKHVYNNYYEWKEILPGSIMSKYETYIIAQQSPSEL